MGGLTEVFGQVRWVSTLRQVSSSYSATATVAEILIPLLHTHMQRRPNTRANTHSHTFTHALAARPGGEVGGDGGGCVRGWRRAVRQRPEPPALLSSEHAPRQRPGIITTTIIIMMIIVIIMPVLVTVIICGLATAWPQHEHANQHACQHAHQTNTRASTTHPHRNTLAAMPAHPPTFSPSCSARSGSWPRPSSGR